MAHNTSGLPPLNLEPFDPTPLYDAARSTQPPARHVGATWFRVLSGIGVLAVLVGAGVALLVG